MSNIASSVKTIMTCAGLCLLTSTSHAVPDISGTYDVGTLTPLERPEAFGNNLFLSEEAAEKIAANIARMRENDAKSADPNRAAPEKAATLAATTCSG